MNNQLNGTSKKPGEGQSPTLLINAQYIKDLSFENPKPLEVMKESPGEAETQINVEVGCDAHKSNKTFFEVMLRITGKVVKKEQTFYLIDLTYVGAFTIHGFPDDVMQFLLFVECPRLLFPFARSIIAQTTQESGLPPIYLAPIDFADLLRQRMEEQEKKGDSSKRKKTPSQ